MTSLVRDDPWSQGAPLGAIPLQYRPPAPRSPAKTRRRKWPWSIGVLLLLFVIVGNYSRSSTSDVTPITHRVASSMAQPLTPAGPSATTTPSVVEPATSSVRNMSLGDGFWIVGEDIVPGIYESGGAQPDSFGLCLVTAHSERIKDRTC